MELAVVALGGNALIHPKERGTAERQIARLNETITHLKPLTEQFRVVLTHGNGPQVGNLLIQQEKSRAEIPEMPLDTLDAMKQGQVGYWIEQSVENILKRNAVTIITRVLVDEGDPAFAEPTKPVGPYYDEKLFPHMLNTDKGYRRLVSSPKPVSIVDIEEIESLVERDFVVIACGGGGILVVCREGLFYGVEAVIDKDYSSAKLANHLKASHIFFLTDVPSAYRDFGKPEQQPIRKMTVKEAQSLVASGEFGEGSMKPKVEAGIDFLVNGGKRAVITSVDEIERALKGEEGTVIE
jgi:carbamate kinase